MDQTHTRAIKALEQFVVLAETTAHPSPRFVADLISRATSAPSTYCFAKLLVTPAVQSLNGPDVPAEQKEYYKLLQIFAWGTLQDYHGKRYKIDGLCSSKSQVRYQSSSLIQTCSRLIRRPLAQRTTDREAPPPHSSHPMYISWLHTDLQRLANCPQSPHTPRPRRTRHQSDLWWSHQCTPLT